MLNTNQSPASPGAFSSLSRGQWMVLLASVLGWLFDGFAVKKHPAQRPAIRRFPQFPPQTDSILEGQFGIRRTSVGKEDGQS